jgi:hypothetical protein
MTEFGLVLPLLMLLILGLADVARAVYTYNVISNAAREGAREAILSYNQCSDVALCSTPPAGTDLVGVQNAVHRAGGSIINFLPINYTTTDSSTAPTCTPHANQACVWVFIVGSANTTDCVPPGPLDASGSSHPCDFNGSKEGGNRDVEVEIEFNFTPFTPLVAGVLGNGTIMWAKSEMRTEY